MKKRFIILSIIIVLVGILLIVKYQNKEVYTEIDGVRYAIVVNGEESTDFPIGNYKVDVNCTNADGYWDSVNHKIILKRIKGSVSCYIHFNTIKQSDYLNNYLIGLSGTNQGNGKLLVENGYRYEGENPDNYVMYNNELWRIIGIFNEESHGNEGLNLVKIIRDDSIGALSWHNDMAVNDWPKTTLYHILNYHYYNWEENYTTIDDYCYEQSETEPGRCNFAATGIKSAYRSFIKKSRWYLGGPGREGYTSGRVNDVYTYERNRSIVSSSKSFSVYNNIGLMYNSDYLYGVLATDCARTKSESSYNTASCAGKDWLFAQGYEWTLTPSTGGVFIWVISLNGRSTWNNTYEAFMVRPTLYLSEKVYRISGTGTARDPYIIGLAS